MMENAFYFILKAFYILELFFLLYSITLLNLIIWLALLRGILDSVLL